MMKVNSLILFLIFPCCVFSSESIFKDAISHFIDDIINSQESSHLAMEDDSIYHHVLLFEDNNIFLDESIPEVIQGYKIIKLNSIKEYLDSCSNQVVTIFTIDKLNYCNICEAQFYVAFGEYYAVKNNSKIWFDSGYEHQVCYTYNKKKRKLNYCYCSSGFCNNLNEVVRRNGWIK